MVGMGKVFYAEIQNFALRNTASEEEFLATVLEPRADTGARYERDGDTLIEYYTPRKYSKGLRCYCGLMSRLLHSCLLLGAKTEQAIFYETT